MSIKLYGVAGSRAARSLWMLEELGLHYENIRTHFVGDAHQPEYLKINPNGRIPALDDNGLLLFESMAINLHLARKYGAGKGLWPASPEDQSRSIQWSFWGMTEVEPLNVKLLMNRLFLPEAERVEAEAIQAERARQKAAGVLEIMLRGRPFLAGEDFTVADLNVYSVLGSDHPALRTPALDGLDARELERIGMLNFDGMPDVERWATRCGERPALARVLAMR
jgi:glutathione S-transferase